MKHAGACLLILALVIPASARERTPAEQIRKIAPGTDVVVKLKGKKTLRGRLGEVRQDGFTLEPVIPHQGWADRELLFQDVRKIGQYKNKLTTTEILLLPVSLVWALGYFLWYGGLPIPY